MLVSLKTYTTFAAVAGSINHVSLAAAQSDNTGAVTEGQSCDSGESMMLACADTSTLMVCNYGVWKFLSACPQGTVCGNNMCINDESSVVFPVPSGGDAQKDTFSSGAVVTDIADIESTVATNSLSTSFDNSASSVDATTASIVTTSIWPLSPDATLSSSESGASTDSESNQNTASDSNTDTESSKVADTSDSTEELDSDEISNLNELSIFDESSDETSPDDDESTDDWFASLKGSASVLTISNQRICLTALSTLALSAVFTWIV